LNLRIQVIKNASFQTFCFSKLSQTIDVIGSSEQADNWLCQMLDKIIVQSDEFLLDAYYTTIFGKNQTAETLDIQAFERPFFS